MKSPIDIVRGTIVDIDKHGIVTIKARYDDWPMLLKREYKECNIQMIDSRPLSDKQRRTCYKLIREISNYGHIFSCVWKRLCGSERPTFVPFVWVPRFWREMPPLPEGVRLKY